MKIRLYNFRCYTDKMFDFGDGGLALLSGGSGKGKTSIIMGIYFALFGTGSKVTAYGKTSCKVELEFDGMKITRTKRPNRLVVNEVYEDASGQEIINKKFGDAFDVTGYIEQDAANSFIKMSSIEKLGFLEKFAFRDIDLGKIKGRCKTHITKCHDELLRTVSQLDMARDVLDKMEPPEEVKFPLKCKKSQRERAINNENICLKNCIILTKRYEKIKKCIEIEINSLNLLNATLKSRTEMKEELDEKLENIVVEIDELIMLYEGENELKDNKKHLTLSLERHKLSVMEDQLENDKIKLEEMRKEESDSLNKELTAIDEVLWKEHNKDDLKETMSELRSYISDLEKVESLRNEIKKCKVDPEKHEEHKSELEKYTKEIEEKQTLCNKLKTQQELYSCPSCKSNLRLINEELINADIVDINYDIDLVTLQEDIISLKHTIRKLHRVIPDEINKLERKTEIETEIQSILLYYCEEYPEVDSLKEDFRYLCEYQTNQTEFEKKKLQLEKSINQEKFSVSYNRFKSSVEKLQKSCTKLIESFDDSDGCIYSEEELRVKISEQEQVRDKLSEYKKRKTDMEEECERYKSILDKARKNHIQKYGIINDKSELIKNIGKEINKIEECDKKKKKHEYNLQQVDKWKCYQDELYNYQVWEVKVEKLTIKEKEDRNKYASATQLKDKILEAESIAMINIVESINTHARLYLDAFFVENPISVQLQPFKQTKKITKPKINIQIEYKGMEADMNMLSGGEKSRVILAYTLALAEMFNTPLLLLDECTSSLDQDLTGVVFDAIRENFNGKLTLIIAHQVVTGTFDKAIKLGE